MLFNPITQPEFKVKKKHHKDGAKKESHVGHAVHKKMAMVEPMAHGKGGQHLKSMKDHKLKGK